MKKSIGSMFLLFVLLTVLVMSGCATTPTPEPTSTPVPPTFTAIPPTFTPSPTPDIQATQRVDNFNTVLKSFVEVGYLKSTEGKLNEINLTEKDWTNAQNVGEGQGTANTWENDKPLSNFLFSARFDWSAEGNTTKDPGCAINFGNGYDVSLMTGGKSKIHFSQNYLANAGDVEEHLDNLQNFVQQNLHMEDLLITSGTGQVDLSNKTEVEFAILVQDEGAFVSVDGKITGYKYPTERGEAKIKLNRFSDEKVAACEMTNIFLWIPK